jgi:sulfatase modifying factor 1
MGSSPADAERANVLCRREILRSRCDELASLFMAERPAHEVTLSSYELDRTEVTVAEYGRCVAAGACAPPGFPPGDERFDRPNFPLTHVRWEDANTYCVWAGGRLPTEAEWEFAARGTAGREYPWGELYNPYICNHGALAHDDTDATDGFVGIAPVGSFPDGATPLGLLDMAGNAAEWVSDYYEIDENGFGYPAASQLNPKGPSHGVMHVVRGGSYLQGAAWMRAAARHIIVQTQMTIAGFTTGFVQSLLLPRSAMVGFRCAADVSR